MNQIKVSVLVGSLRQQSVTLEVARAFVAVAPANLSFSFVEIGDLQLYNEELEGQAPASWTRFRAEVRATDALLFFTPEFNRGVPGALETRSTWARARGVAALPQPEAYIGDAGSLFDEQGNLTNASRQEFATGFMRSFGAWVAQQRAPISAPAQGAGG